MAKETKKRIRLLKLWEILRQETDEYHPIGTVKLLAKLQSIGIECDRRTLYADIQLLNDFGYEILKNRSRSNEYYIVERSFDEPEIHILMDAVQEARFITDKKTEEFVDKIANLAGSRRAEALKQNTVRFNTTKTDNEGIYYNIDTIKRAIDEGKKIKFIYFDYDIAHERVYRKERKFYYMNPVATVMDNGNYYLLCYDSYHPKILHFRVDRMEQVLVSRHDKDEREEFANFDVKAHKRQIFGMFSGKEQDVTLRAKKELIDAVFDLFGSETKLVFVEEDTFEFQASVQVSDLFFGWCCSFGEKVQLIAPESARQELKKYVENLAKQYAVD